MRQKAVRAEEIYSVIIIVPGEAELFESVGLEREIVHCGQTAQRRGGKWE